MIERKKTVYSLSDRICFVFLGREESDEPETVGRAFESKQHGRLCVKEIREYIQVSVNFC